MSTSAQQYTANKAILDGDMMNCCMQDINAENAPGAATQVRKTAENYRFEDAIDAYGNNPSYYYTTCYDPSVDDINMKPCPKDLAGNSQYACFPALGDQIPNCRSTCLYGHPQSNERTLHESRTLSGMPIMERGVELYENFALDETLRTDSGRYGEKYQGCISDLGRRVSLYGNIKFTVTKYEYIAGFAGDYSPNYGIPEPTAVVYMIDVYNQTAQFMGVNSYQYFGNYGVVFHYNGQQIPFIVSSDGNYDLTYPNGYVVSKKYVTNSDYSYYSYIILDYYANPNHFDYYTDNYAGNVFAGNITQPIYDDKTSCNNLFNVSAPLFPYSYMIFSDDHPYTCDPGHKGSNPTPRPLDCSASGVKSIYIPPHMAITNVTYFNTKSSSSSTKISGTFKSEDSKYLNGTFHAVGLDTINSDHDDSFSNKYVNARNATIKIPAGAFKSLFCYVRQDDAFYNKCVKPYLNQFAPEIFLIPGVEYANTFIYNSTVENLMSKSLDPLQMIKKAQDFWDPAKNPYCDGSNYVAINSGYFPGETVYRPSDSPPIESTRFQRLPGVIKYDPVTGTVTCNPTTQSAKKSTPSFITDPLKKLEAIGKSSWQAIDAFSRKYLNLNVETVDPYYRIQYFTPYNGIYSIEWLYVLFNCAVTGRKNISVKDNMYVFPNDCSKTNTCQKECMYFRDPSKYNCTDVQNNAVTTSAADDFMQIYCGMRSLSAVYLNWQQGTSKDSNMCSCYSSGNTCESTNAGQSCDKSSANINTYAPASVCVCGGTAVCTNCNLTIFQLSLALSLGCYNSADNSGSNNADVSGACPETSQCIGNLTINAGDDTEEDTEDDTKEDPDDPDDPKDPKDDTTTSSASPAILVVIFIIIAIIIAVIFGVYYYKKHKKNAPK